MFPATLNLARVPRGSLAALVKSCGHFAKTINPEGFRGTFGGLQFAFVCPPSIWVLLVVSFAPVLGRVQSLSPAAPARS